MKVEYRFARNDDIDQLVHLRALMQLEVNPKSIITDEYKKNVRNYFFKSFSENKYYSSIAIYENQIVANAGVVFYEKPPSIYGGSGLVGYITNVYTLQKYRKLGIGTHLIQNINLLAKDLGADKLHLGATSDGIKLYKSLGYQEPRDQSLQLSYPFGT